YWETVQAPPPGERRAHQYSGDLDRTDWSPTFDLYGGGGLVSTVRDMVRFVRPLLQGHMFDKPETLAMALQTPPSANGQLSHAPLLAQVKFGKRMCWSHGGFWGIQMIYCPDIDVAVAVAWNQSDSAKWGLYNDILSAAIEDIHASRPRP
ncbi:serine hydrolase domain-containing protein, partial [Phenylobacterium sp.]|uniref:serine hydrolase domain-containing protein n=1 Tax=Phenylobacterium sp. TaxID=1871053 RepID=UPI00378324BF